MRGPESSEGWGVLGRGGPDNTGPECRWPFNGRLVCLLSKPRLNLALGGCGGLLGQVLSLGLRIPFVQLLLASAVGLLPPVYRGVGRESQNGYPPPPKTPSFPLPLQLPRHSFLKIFIYFFIFLKRESRESD